MHKNIHSIIIAMLAVGLLVTGAGVYLLSTQLADLKQTVNTPPKVSAESPNGKCVNSGGTYKNARCTCQKDFHLEDSYCVGPDGSFGGVMGEQMRADLDLEFKKNSCSDSGGEFENGKCSCGKDYFLEKDQCMGQDGLTKAELEVIKANQEKLMNQNR